MLFVRCDTDENQDKSGVNVLSPTTILIATFSGGLVGTLKDPPVLAMMALCLVAGLLRWPKYVPLLVMALVVAAFTYFSLLSWCAEIGIGPRLMERSSQIFGFWLFLAYLAYGIGFGISAFRRRRTKSP